VDITIRKAIKEDADSILKIQKKAFLFQANKYSDYDMPPMVEKKEDVLNEMITSLIFVAIYNDKIIGSIRIRKQEDEAEIRRLAVLDEYQGNGVGNMLMNVAEMQYLHLKRYWLLTGKESYRSISLYKKLGYEIYKEAVHRDYILVYLQKLL